MQHTKFSYAKRTKVFGIMIFLVISILSFLSFLSFVSATTTVTLNSPVDNYLSPTINVTFNCSFSSNNYINNFSLWTNSTGIFSRNLTIDYVNNTYSNSFGNGTDVNSSFYQGYSLGCAVFNGHANLLYQPYPTYLYSLGHASATQSCGGGWAGDGNGLRTINLNDKNDYNIQFRMNTSSSASNSAGYQTFFSITNTSYSDWTNIFVGSCGQADTTGRTLIYTKSIPNSFLDTNYTLTIINGNLTLYNNSGIIYSANIVYTGNWYFTIETWNGATSDCSNNGDTSTNLYVYNFSIASLGRKNSTEIFSQTFDKFNNNPFKWNCNAIDNNAISTFASLNRSVTIDTTPPTINITYPYGQISYAFVGQNLTFNWTVSDNGILNNCWFNYNSYGNISVPCNQNYS